LAGVNWGEKYEEGKAQVGCSATEGNAIISETEDMVFRTDIETPGLFLSLLYLKRVPGARSRDQ
jgi:hypothetical protein